MTVVGEIVADRFCLVRSLGVGGMGSVWQARDEVLARDVAVKEIVPLPDLPPGHADVWTRTVREARTSARLTHPNVVRVYDVLFARGRPWIVMEYVPGRSLYAAVHEDGPILTQDAIRIALAVLDGLEAVHRAGVLHRDVKPHNVLLADDGRIMLADFGVAVFRDEKDDIVLGSPGYVAPERVREGASTVQTDLWSFGATLYWMLEAKPPTDWTPNRVDRLGAVVDGLLQHDPAERLTAEAARALLAEQSVKGPVPAAWPALPVPPPDTPAVPTTNGRSAAPSTTGPAITPPAMGRAAAPASARAAAPSTPSTTGPAATPPSTGAATPPSTGAAAPTSTGAASALPARRLAAFAGLSLTPAAVPAEAFAALAAASAGASAVASAVALLAPPNETDGPTPPDAMTRADNVALASETTPSDRPAAIAGSPLGRLVDLPFVDPPSATNDAKAGRSPISRRTVVAGVATAALVGAVATVTGFAVADARPATNARARALPDTLSCASAADPHPDAVRPASISTPLNAGGETAALPTGWVRELDSGFSIGVPGRWRRSTTTSAVCLLDPTGRRAVAVSADAPLDPDRVGYWQREEGHLLDGQGPTGYQRVDISPALYRNGGADWEYRYDAGGVRWHVLRRAFAAGNGKAYVISWTTPDAEWDGSQHDFRTVMQSFESR